MCVDTPAQSMCVDVHEGPKTAVEKAEAAKALTLHHTLLLTHHGNLPPIASYMIFEFAEPLVKQRRRRRGCRGGRGRYRRVIADVATGLYWWTRRNW
jgi:hypothetical protein